VRVASDEVATDADRLRANRRRSAAARRWRPETVDLLIVAETPPSALDRYFYFEDVAEQDSLFRYVAKALLGATPSRANKALALAQLRDRSVFLIDVKADPYDPRPLMDFVDDLIRRCSAVAPRAIVLVKANVHDVALAPLQHAGLPVVNVRVPFPGSGQQRNFEAAFAKALDAVGMLR
jgi:hypothetical protein